MAETIKASPIILHFEKNEHNLPLDQFVDNALSIKEIIRAFDEEFADGELKYDILVVPPRDGGFIETYLLVISVVGPFWGFICSPPGKAFIEGLTDHEPSYWLKKAGVGLKEYLLEESTKKPKTLQISQDKKPKNTVELVMNTDSLRGNRLEERNKEQIEQNKNAAVIVSQIAINFINKKPDQLMKVGLLKRKFRKAYKAKNKIFEGCLNNPNIKGLGFDYTQNFPIKQNQFLEHIVEIPEDNDEDEPDNWKVETKHIKVYSPNWRREGRKWQAITDNKKEVWFTIEDEQFWHLVKTKDIQPDINDSMMVQWAYPAESTSKSKLKVLRVLKYNGQDISVAMNEDELLKELNHYSHSKSNQSDLFN